MALNAEFVKQHWKVLAGSTLGLILLLILLKRSSASANHTTTPALSGSSDQIQALNTSAGLASAQINGQVSMTQLTTQSANVATAAALQASLADTAGKVAVALHGEDIDLAKTAITTKGAVDTQQLISSAQVAQTAILGMTYTDIAKTNANAATSVQIAQINAVSKQVGTLMQFSKHFDSDIQKAAPILTAELGLSSASIAASSANAQTNVATKQASAAKVGAISSAVSSVAQGLFAGA